MKSNNVTIVSSMFLSALTLLPTACSNFEYGPYGAEISGDTHVIEKNLQAIEKCRTELPLRFAFITDSHDYNDDMRDAIAAMEKRGDIDFLVHGGDLTDYGLPREFMWCRDAMESTDIPFVTILGNHDCLGNGEDTYEYIFGPKNYAFTVAGVHFVCLNTIALEYDYSEPVPDLNFIEADAASLDGQNITHTVVLMHSSPYDEQFNNNVAKPFNYYLKIYPGMGDDDPRIDSGEQAGSRRFGFCANGHNHNFSIKDIFGDGLLFYQGDSVDKRTFMVFTLTYDGYEMERVRF